MRDGLFSFWVSGPSGFESATVQLEEERGHDTPFSLFLPVSGLGLRTGLEGSTGSLLGAGVKEDFFVCGLEKVEEGFWAESGGSGVGEDLGSD